MNREINLLLKKEMEGYKNNFSKRDWLIAGLTNDPQYMLWKYHKRMRIAEYYYNKYKSSTKLRKGIYCIMFLWKKLKRNNLGNKLSVDIRENSFDEGLVLFHNNIVINGHSVIGKNCKLHGNNIIGNNGRTTETPVIGDNVDIGVGAVIIGAIQLADNIKVGAGAVVIKSFTTSGVTIVGVPAHEVGDLNNEKRN